MTGKEIAFESVVDPWDRGSIEALGYALCAPDSIPAVKVEPGETVRVAFRESLHVPLDRMAEVGPHGAAVDRGLEAVSAFYQEGHRAAPLAVWVRNVSDGTVELRGGDPVAFLVCRRADPFGSGPIRQPARVLGSNG